MKIGNWKYKEDNLTIEYQNKNMWYEVDLERCNNSAQILDWIFQISQKSWVTENAIKDLLEILTILLQPQKYFCSWGKDRTLKVTREFISGNIKHYEIVLKFLDKLRVKNKMSNSDKERIGGQEK